LPHIAHFISYTGTALGGPVNGMAGFVGLLAGRGYSVTVFSSVNGMDGESVRLDSRVCLVQEPASPWGGFRRSPSLWGRVRAAEIDLVHSHGLWTDVNRLAAATARRRDLPHLLAPCGMLAPGALRHHGWKKVPIRFWFQDRALREAQCLHAKSCQEYEHIRRFGLRNPVAVIANPIAVPSLALGPRTTDHGPRTTIPNRRTVLFLGRLHPVKGLERLVRAWGNIQTEQAESRKQKWVLVLAGPDERGYRREVESLVAELRCGDSVVFTGELDDQQKWGALAAADVFVMPSDFENFGNAIVEAMSCAIPVITTTGTPWEELRTAGAGWWVEPRVEELTAALREALAMPEEQRQAMGKRAARLAAKFSPEQAGADLIQVYRWLLGENLRPACVRLD
jgi:glycosyltransferase involved in cell wall biosynthesis